MKRRELVAFDVKAGLPTAIRTLKAELGTRRALRVLASFVRRSLGRDPLKSIPRPPVSQWSADDEWLSRHQYRPVVILDDVLRDLLGLDVEQRVEVLRAVISASGARFLAANVSIPEAQDWEAADDDGRKATVAGMVERFFNARVDKLHTSGTRAGFDVNACRFAEISVALGREYLAPLFCAADSAYFGTGASPVRLERTETIATGGSCCDFRFGWNAID